VKIFISWSGQRSQALALALRDWIPLVLHYAEPWLSTSDIKSGDRWNIEVAKELQESKFGIICVTKDNLEAPWLLFESGALAKSVEDGRVIPLRLDLDPSDISGPLTQFQSERADKDGVKRLILSLNAVAVGPVLEDRLNQLFSAMWGNLEHKISEIPASGSPQKKARPQAEILEELVSGVRNVEMRVRDISEDDISTRRRTRKRLDPMMVRHLARETGTGPDDPLQLVIIASLIREDAPWIYELALDTYRMTRAGDKSLAKQSHARFLNAIKTLIGGPFLDMMGIDKTSYMMLRESLHMLEEIDMDASSFVSPRRRVSSPGKPSE
jgi:hypothetical protein